MGFEIEDGVLIKYTEKRGLTKIVIPDSVNEIGEKAFVYCSSIKYIKISDRVTTILR